MAVMMAGFAAMMVGIIYRGLRNDRVRDIDDPSARRVVRFEVNLNEADWPEIAQLPKIGPVMARRIVEYRRINGPFRSIDNVTMVKGIGTKTLAEITPYLTIGDLAVELQANKNETSPTVARRP